MQNPTLKNSKEGYTCKKKKRVLQVLGINDASNIKYHFYFEMHSNVTQTESAPVAGMQKWLLGQQ